MTLRLREVTGKDMDLLFRWANDPVTRKNAFHTEQIPYETHRAWFVKMLAEAFGITSATEENSFADVETGRWSERYIAAAASNGIVSGIGDGKFAPESVVTRQDAAVMLKRICDKYGISLEGSAKAFADDAKIASYAAESVSLLSGAGVITGFEDGTFRPTSALTRAQAAKIIYGLIK